MEITLLKVLLSNISSLLSLSSHEAIKHEPAQKYYRITKEILNTLKSVLNGAFGANITSSDPLHLAIKELSDSVEELKELFENWHPLRSKIYFVLEVESYISKARASGIEILQLLISSDYGLPFELDVSPMEFFIQNIKNVALEQTSVIVNEAIREQEDGSGPSSETLEKFGNSLSLKSNQELLIEAVALEKLKDNAEQAENNTEAEYYEQLIALVTQMHEHLFTMKQSEGSNPVPIPADFCCPLSLELMTDPVIVTSGQTYERAFIRKWIDIGLTVCPKTRQTLSHTNLVPNYTVKALIANWCEINNIKLPDPVKSANLKLPSYLAISTSNQSTSTESTRSNELTRKDSVSSSEGSIPAVAQNGNELTIDSPKSPLRAEPSSQGHSRNASASSLSSLSNSQNLVPDSNDVSSLPVTAYNSDTSGEQTSEQQATPKSTSSRRENVFPSRLEIRNRSQSMFRRPIPRIVSSPTLQTRADMSEVEAQVKILAEKLQSSSLDEQKGATSEIRLLAKHNMDNRIVIASCGAIEHLVKLLHSSDTEIQENAVTALLNLSINDNNKAAIANVGAIDPLIHVLETGTPEAKENSAATLFSLSVVEENKVRIGRSGAINALVDLLGNGTPRGKKDASTALFNLSILHENKARIVQAGAVKYLVELMDPAAGMVDKAVAVLANLATIQEGRTAIGQEGGISVLVEVVELGSARGKENAAAALLQLCTSSNRYCNTVIHEGAVPPLVALSQSGTPRAKEKAQALLSHFRNQRHVNGGRS